MLTLGASSDSESIFNDALAAFEPVILKGRTASVRAAAIEALAMMCFVAGEGGEETVHVMDLFKRNFTGGKNGAAGCCYSNCHP